MPGYIEDRWYRKGPDGKRSIETDRHGQGMRYKVTGIPGVRSRSFPDGKLAAAKKWLTDAQTDSGRGDFYDVRDGAITLDTFVREHWWPHVRYPPTTKASVKSRVFNHILPHIGAQPLNRIGFEEIRAWVTRAEQNIDAGTLFVTWTHFSTIMQAAHKAKRIPLNPFRDEDLKAPTVPESKATAWDKATVAAVRAALPERYRILAMLAVAAGLRQGEAFAFSPDDIKGDDLHITRQIIKVSGHFAFSPPKRRKERYAPCPPELAAAIRAHMEAFPPVEVTLPWVDPDRPNLAWKDRPLRTVRLLVTTTQPGGNHGGSLNRDTFNDRQWKPALRDAGLIPAPEVEWVEPKAGKNPWRREKWTMPREFGFHVLRHTFASIVLAEGETITKLASWLGHSDPAFTLRVYTHFMPKAGNRGRAALGMFITDESGEGTETPGEASEMDLPKRSPRKSILKSDATSDVTDTETSDSQDAA